MASEMRQAVPTRPSSAPNALESTGISNDCYCCCTCKLLPVKTSPQGSVCSLHQSLLQLQDELIDKDHTIHSLTDEVHKLKVYQIECSRKDNTIKSLREEIALLNKTAANRQLKVSSLDQDIETSLHQIQEKDFEIQKLQANVTELTDKLKKSTRQVSALQSQLSRKNQVLLSHCEELRQLKKEKRFVDDSLNSSTEQSKEKQSTISSLNERIRRLKTLNQELQSKYDTTLSSYTQLTNSENLLRQELSQVKTKSNQIKLQLNTTQEELTKCKSSNEQLTSDLKNMKNELERLCHSLSVLIGLQSSSKHYSSVDSIVSNVSLIVTEQLQLKQSIQKLQEEIDEVIEQSSSLLNGITSMSNSISTIKSSALTSAVISSVQHLQIDSVLHPLQSLLINCLTEISDLGKRLDTISSTVKPVLLQWNAIQDEENVVNLVNVLTSKALKYEKDCTSLQEKLTAVSDHNAIVMQQTLASVRDENQDRLSREIARIKDEEKRNYERELLKLKSSHEDQLKELNTQKLFEIQIMKTQIKEMEKKLNSKCNEVQELLDTIELNKQDRSQLLTQIEEINVKMKEMETKYKEELNLLEAKKISMESELSQNLTEYKVQCQEHAVTIVSLKGQFLTSSKDCKVWKDKETEMRTKCDNLQKELESLQAVIQNSNDKSQTLLMSMRRQLTNTNVNWEKDRQKVKELENTLIAIQSSFKAEIDKLNESHRAQVKDLKEQLSQKETILADLNVSNQSFATPPTIETVPAITTANNETQSDINSIDKDALVATGYRCLGENHTQTIESQRFAINEMRRKLEEMAGTCPPVPSHAAALKELARLREELIQLKTEQIISREQEEVDKKVESSLDVTCMTNGESHYVTELKESLKDSEQSYNELLVAVCEQLLIPFPTDYKSLLEANKVARQQILHDRNRFIIGSLSDAVDLMRQRNAKKNVTKIVQDESTNMEPQIATIDLSPYGIYSTEALEKLDQEKRLQQAINKRQEFKYLKQNKSRDKHSCLVTPDELKQKMDELRKMYTEKLEKKSLEISQLRKELESIKPQNNVVN